MPQPKRVTRYTRAGREGRVIRCPHCGAEGVVYHFAWSALECLHCHRLVPKYKWLVVE